MPHGYESDVTPDEDAIEDVGELLSEFKSAVELAHEDDVKEPNKNNQPNRFAK